MFALIGFVFWTIFVFAAGMKTNAKITQLDDNSGTRQFIDEVGDSARSLVRGL